MELSRFLIDFAAGWLVWSLAHNLGHRWWHDEMRSGKTTFYAKGEREHHRIYDRHGARALQLREDPSELFISFPLPVIAAFASIFVLLYGWLCGFAHMWPFGSALYGSMLIDHRLHILFHRTTRLPGPFAWFQRMHMRHHATHDRNFFFVSGLLWDLMFNTLEWRGGAPAEGVLNTVPAEEP